MKSFIFIIVYIVLVLSNCSAQRWRLGIVVPYDEDTMRGFIHSKPKSFWHREPSTVQFKNSKDGGSFIYAIPDLQYFKSGNKAYVHVYLAEKSGDEVDKGVWAQVLVKGDSVTLYQYREQYYYSYGLSSTATKLIYKWSRELDIYGYSHDEENITFKCQLKSIARHLGWGEMFYKSIDSCPYTSYHISNLFIKFNGRTATLAYPHEQDGWQVSFFAAIAGGFSQAKVLDGDLAGDSPLRFNKALTSYSMGADIHFSFSSLFCRLDLTYSSSGTYKGITTTGQNRQQAFQFNQNNLAIGISILNTFCHRPHVEWYGGIGALLSTALSKRNIDFKSGYYFPERNQLLLKEQWSNLSLRGGAIFNSKWEAGCIIVPFADYTQRGYTSVLKGKTFQLFFAYHLADIVKYW